MRTALERTIDFIWHPFLLVTFDLLALLVANLGQLPAAGLFRPWLVLNLASVLLLGLAWLAIRDWHKAGLLVTVGLALFLSYGHVYSLVEGQRLFGLDVGRHRLLLPVFTLAFIFLAILLLRSRRRLAGWTRGLNLVTGILVLMQAGQLAWAGIGSSRLEAGIDAGGGSSSASALFAAPGTASNRPDIYFIVLDTYTRQDAYQTLTGFDNSAFLEALREREFSIADCSLSNYTSTSASILASLDSAYLWDLDPPPPAGLNQIRYLDPYLLQNRVMATLKELGYTTVAFESGYSPTEILTADEYLTPQHAGLLEGGLTRFESLALQSSAGILLFDSWSRLPDGLRYFLDATYVAHRERMLFELARLGDLSGTRSPKFVFAHILAPHTPFVFTRDGQPVVRNTPFTLNDDPELSNPALYRERFVDQTIYMNGRVLELVDTILAQPGDPVIVLQGDHGLPSSGEWRTAILNAIHLPGGGDGLYPSISPVNTFRVVFNDLFAAGLPLEPDRSCRFNRSDPYACQEIVEPNPACQVTP